MSVYMVNFATSQFYGGQKIQNVFSKKAGIKQVFSYNGDWLKKTDLFKQNKQIFSVARGFGLWAWKPYIILETFNYIDDNQIVFYMDCDFYIKRDITPLVDICKQKDGIVLFCGGHICEHWIKRDCFCLMGCDDVRFYKMPLLMAGINMWMKNQHNIDFLEEWLQLCLNFNLISDDPSYVCNSEELPSFKEHRHDQSILTLLAIKRNIESYRVPFCGSDKINMANSKYGLIVGKLPRVENNEKKIKAII